MKKLMLFFKLLAAYIGLTLVQYIRPESLIRVADTDGSMFYSLFILLLVGVIIGMLLRTTENNIKPLDNAVIILSSCLFAFGIPLLYWLYIIPIPYNCLKSSDYFILILGIYLIKMIPNITKK